MRKSVMGLLIVLAALFLTAQACSNFYMYQGPESDLALMCTIDGEFVCDTETYEALECESGATSGSWNLIATGADCVVDDDGDLVPVLHPIDSDADGDGVLDSDDVCPGVDDASAACAPATPTLGGCVVGTVVDALGDPRVGVDVIVHGETSYISTTDASGDFCLEVHDGLVGKQLEVQYQVGGQDATQLTDFINVDAGTTSCSSDTSACLNFGVIPADVMTTVSGAVVRTSGLPLSGREVQSSSLGTALDVDVSGSDGSFCLLVPVFRTIQLYVTNYNGFVPISLFTQPDSDLDCADGSPNIAVLQPYPDTTCVHGQLLGSSVANVPVGVHASGFESYPVSATQTNDEGYFCLNEVPSATNLILGFNDETEALDSSAGFLGALCGDVVSASAGECLELESLSLS